MPEQLTNLRDAIAAYRSYLEEQLRDCESGKFKLYSVEGGRQIDTTPDHIAQIKRLIAEHDRLLGQS